MRERRYPVSPRFRSGLIIMSILSDEAAQIVESLPADKTQALLECARYLAETVDREQWERRLGVSR